MAIAASVPAPARRRLAFALGAAITLHNGEEWLTFPRFGEPLGALLRRWNLPVAPPPMEVLRAGLIAATVVPLALILIAVLGDRTAWKEGILAGISAVFLVNVLVPHVPAAFALGGYSPGVVTALLINLPVCVLMIREVHRRGMLSPFVLRLALLAGALTLPLTLAILLMVRI